MDIQDMRIFARVAAVQNLSAVGIELGLTPGTISKRIQALEDELSARLFDRTTRSIRITEEGAAFLTHVQLILAEVEAARASVDDRARKPKGKLRIAAPAGLGRRYVAPALCAFLRDYPQIEAQLDLIHRQVNLQEDGFDVAVRSGALSDSSVIAKRLAPDRHVIAGSADYIARRGRPTLAEDLAGHSCLVLGDRSQWSLGRNGAEKTVRVGGPFRSNDGELLCQAALDGHGLICASELEILPELRSGRLVEVLSDHEVASNAAVWALYPSAKHMLPRLRVLLDFLTQWFRDARVQPGDGNVLRVAAQ
jgi:DNA-binding transcriptional LysR family regulator